jgi:hypothetical protein
MIAQRVSAIGRPKISTALKLKLPSSAITTRAESKKPKK